MTDSVIERMAEAIFLEEGRNKDVAWKDADKVLFLVPPTWNAFKPPLLQAKTVSDYYRAIARAALAAAREPTAEMIQGAYSCRVLDVPIIGVDGDETVIWQAMIDAALEESK